MTISKTSRQKASNIISFFFTEKLSEIADRFPTPPPPPPQENKRLDAEERQDYCSRFFYYYYYY